MYNNDIRVANTATPLVGETNVSQYGWTTSDRQAADQMQVYVNLCKEYATTSEDAATYIQDVYGETQEFIKYIEAVYEELKPLADGLQDVYTDITVRHEDVKTKHLDVVQKSNQINLWHSETKIYADAAKVSAEEAHISESNAKTSEVESEKWYEKTHDLYLDLKEGQVYRGTWNPKNSFPDHQGTNSVWDVILDDGASNVPQGGFTWNNGDRLIYVLSETKYDQLKTSSGVTSVNGKKGAVTLNATDVKALPSNGGQLTGTIYTALSGNLLRYTNPNGNGVTEQAFVDDYLNYRMGSNNITKGIQLSDYNDPRVQLNRSGTVWAREGFLVGPEKHAVYHKGYAPTARDVGATTLGEANISLWNRQVVDMEVGNSFVNYTDGGRNLTPRLIFEGKCYIPMFDATTSVTFTGIPVKNPNGSITVSTDKGSRQFTATGAEAVARSELNGYNVEMFGAIGDGVADDSDAFQKAFDAFDRGVITCYPNKVFKIDKNITIGRKDPGNPSGGFGVDFSGSRFVGNGRFIVDSCKHLELKRITAPNMDIELNGIWFSTLDHCMFRKIYLSASKGTNFDAAYWNIFEKCTFQSIVKNAISGNAHNEFTFNQCRLRGNKGQGFESEADYALELLGNSNCQSWKFYGGDFSYHTKEIFNISTANTSDIEIAFDGVYWDTKLPQFIQDRPRTVVHTVRCHNAIGVGSKNPFRQGKFSSVVGQTTQLYQSSRSYNFSDISPLNLVPGGDMRSDLGVWHGEGKPFRGTTNGSSMVSGTGGITGTTVIINAPNGGIHYTRTVPLAGDNIKLTGCIVLRNKDVGTREIQLGFNGLYENEVTISDQYWSVFSLTDERMENNSGDISLIIASTGAQQTAYNVEIAYAGVFYGADCPLFAQGTGFQTIELVDRNPWDLTGLSDPGAQLHKDFSVPGAKFGDFALYTINDNNQAVCRLTTHAKVFAEGVVRVTLTNPSSATITELPSNAESSIRVWKRSLM